MVNLKINCPNCKENVLISIENEKIISVSLGNKNIKKSEISQVLKDTGIEFG